jgi:hypothetical protein
VVVTSFVRGGDGANCFFPYSQFGFRLRGIIILFMARRHAFGSALFLLVEFRAIESHVRESSIESRMSCDDV